MTFPDTPDLGLAVIRTGQVQDIDAGQNFVGPETIVYSPRWPYKFARERYRIPEGIPCDNPTERFFPEKSPIRDTGHFPIFAYFSTICPVCDS